MISIRWRMVNQFRLNTVVMFVIIGVLSVYGLVTNTSLFDPIFFAFWMTASIDGTISGIITLILKNIH